MATVSEYVQRAEARIVEVLEEHHAVVVPELQSRVSEAGHRDSAFNIDPHHVTSALRNLYDTDRIISQSSRTRGGRSVMTIRLHGVSRRETQIERTTARKRILMARYQGWSQGTKRHPHGLIGPAVERAVRSGILLSGALQPAVPGAEEVKSLLGTRLKGPSDSAGYLVPLTDGLPGAPITILFEVKNLRSWIYPSSHELYQLLDKAAALQRARPAQAVVGVLVCRRTHKTTYWMARQLGFIVIEMDIQFAGPVNGDDLDEIRNELHFTDIREGDGPSLRVRDRFASSRIPTLAPTIATTWRATALNDRYASLFAMAREAGQSTKRLRAVDMIRALARAEGLRGGW